MSRLPNKLPLAPILAGIAIIGFLAWLIVSSLYEAAHLIYGPCWKVEQVTGNSVTTSYQTLGRPEPVNGAVTFTDLSGNKVTLMGTVSITDSECVTGVKE